MNSLLLIKSARVSIQGDIAEDKYEFQKDPQGSYTEWANGWNNPGKSNPTVHNLKWELNGSLELDQKSVSVNVSS